MQKYHGSSNYDDEDVARWNRETELLASYPYRSADGTLAFFNDKGQNRDGRKPYRPRRPNLMPFSDRLEPEDKVDEYFHLRGVPRPLPLFNLPALLDSERSGEAVWIAEGERDATSLMALGLLATTNYGGALKWKKAYSEVLRGRDVILLPDNDQRGRQHAAQIVRMSSGVVGRLRILPLPDLPEKGDVTDWLEAGGTKEQLLTLAATTAIEVRRA